MRLKFVEGIPTSWGHYECACGTNYSIVGPSVHNPGCLESEDSGAGNGNVTYCFGPKEVEAVMKDPSGRSKFGVLRRSDLEAEFERLPPEVQERMRSFVKR